MSLLVAQGDVVVRAHRLGGRRPACSVFGRAAYNKGMPPSLNINFLVGRTLCPPVAFIIFGLRTECTSGITKK